ncbi:hypothetical protein [uncultured Mediterranean phage uvMED]|jgi:hypothetical protein|nr:hypothetical protein [uncultured Mediterranean phage uvMED]
MTFEELVQLLKEKEKLSKPKKKKKKRIKHG